MSNENNSQELRQGINAADRDQTLLKMMSGVAFAAALIVGLRTQSWVLGIGVFVALLASTYLRGRWATLAALAVGAGCAWAAALLGQAMFESTGGAVAGALLGFVVGAGAHVGASRYNQDNQQQS
jgi:hypothetical protein